MFEWRSVMLNHLGRRFIGEGGAWWDIWHAHTWETEAEKGQLGIKELSQKVEG